MCCLGYFRAIDRILCVIKEDGILFLFYFSFTLCSVNLICLTTLFRTSFIFYCISLIFYYDFIIFSFYLLVVFLLNAIHLLCKTIFQKAIKLPKNLSSFQNALVLLSEIIHCTLYFHENYLLVFVMLFISFDTFDVSSFEKLQSKLFHELHT